MTLTSSLVPYWRLKNDVSGLGKNDRPVQIALERIGALLRGQILSISSTHAEIMPDDTCHLFRKVNASLRFRMGDAAFCLTGLAVSCEHRRTIVLEFDKATRANMAMVRNHGLAPVTHEESIRPLPGAPGTTVVRRRSKEEQRTVLHLPPPDGVERRVEPRFNFDARTTLYLCEADGIVQCTILEISRTGCRLFSEAPFNLRADMHTEVTFHGNGEFHRISAQVRPKFDEHLTGLLFVDMDSRRQDRVDDLVLELKERGGRGSSHLDI